MKFYSEVTKKFYDSVEECEQAEKVEQEKISNKQNRYDEASKALDVAAELINDYIKDYGSFPAVSTNDNKAIKFTNDLINFFFK